MRKLKVAILVFLVFAVSFAFVFTATPAKPSDENLPILYLSGTSREMGLRQGLLLSKSIKENLNLFWEAVVSQGLSKEELLAQTIERERFLPPNMAEELRAMAEGAGANYYELVAMNIFGEEFMGAECTSGIAAGTGTLTGQAIGHKNRDSTGTQILVIREPTGGNPYRLFAVTTSGYSGISHGINEVGVGTGNLLLSGPQTYDEGVDNLMINRLILEKCGSVDEAVTYVDQEIRQDPSCFMVADANKVAYIEAVPYGNPAPGIVVNIVENGVAAHANHYLYEPFKTRYASYASTSSKTRYERMNYLMTSNAGQITVKLMIQFSRDRGSTTYYIESSNTVSAGIMTPHETYPTMLSAMWTSIFRPGYTIYVPLHSAILQHPTLASTELTEYRNGAAYTAASNLKKKYKETSPNWAIIKARFVLIEDDIRDNNAFNENLVTDCFQKGRSLADCTKHLTIQDSWTARRAVDIEQFMYSTGLTPPITSLYIPPPGPARARLTTQTNPTNVGAPILGAGWYELNAGASADAPATYGQYTFNHWTVNGNTVPGNPITVTMNANYTATAYYN